MAPRPLLFDLDGTLIDSKADLAAAVNRLLVELGVPPLPPSTLHGFIGRGARSMVGRALDATDPGRLVPRDDQTLRRFLGHYTEVLLDSTVAFPGVEAGLHQLQAAGVPMAVVTNKPIEPAMACLDGLGLTHFFAVVLGGDSLDSKKPEPGMLVEAARRLGVSLERCLMVGDSDVDIEAATRAGVPALWCRWGGIHLDRPIGSYRAVDRFEEVVDLSLGPSSDSLPSAARPH